MHETFRSTRLRLALNAILLSTFLSLAVQGQPSKRSTKDEPDLHQGPQIHFLYVLPYGAKDRKLDTSGAIERSVDVAFRWLKQQTGVAGKELRVDRRKNGDLDVTFVRLTASPQVLESQDFLVDQLTYELWALDFDDPSKLYVAYYGGTPSEGACGITSFLGTLAILTPEGDACPVPFQTSPTQPPGEWEFTLIHEVFHLLGAVDKRSKRIDPDNPGHLKPADPQDLMTTDNWRFPPKIDVSRDAYYGHGNPNLLDVARSPFWDPSPANIQHKSCWPVMKIASSLLQSRRPSYTAQDSWTVIANLSAAPVLVHSLDQNGQSAWHQVIYSRHSFKSDVVKEGSLWLVTDLDGSDLALYRSVAPAALAIFK